MKNSLLNLMLMFLILPITIFSSEVFAIQVDTNTSVTLLRPATYDGDACNVEVFSEKVSDLGLPNAPVLAAHSKYDSAVNNPAGNRGALVVEVNQMGMSTEVLRIEGLKTTTDDIQNKLTSGTDLRLTEYKKCAEADPSLQLVELVNLNPNPHSFVLDFGATLQIVRKNDQGVCDVMVSKTLGELVQGYNPGVDLNSVGYSVNIFANGVTNEGQLHSKRVYISFKDGNGFPLSRPNISITVASSLTYTVLDRLSGPNEVLAMSGIRDCLGTRMDDPVWILDLEFQ